MSYPCDLPYGSYCCAGDMLKIWRSSVLCIRSSDMKMFRQLKRAICPQSIREPMNVMFARKGSIGSDGTYVSVGCSTNCYQLPLPQLKLPLLHQYPCAQTFARAQEHRRMSACLIHLPFQVYIALTKDTT